MRYRPAAQPTTAALKIADQFDSPLKRVGTAIDNVGDGGRLSGFNVKSPVPLLDETLLRQGIEPEPEFQLGHAVIIASRVSGDCCRRDQKSIFAPVSLVAVGTALIDCLIVESDLLATSADSDPQQLF